MKPAATSIPAGPADPSSLRLVLTLSLAGLLSGLIIVGIFEATLPTITAYQAAQLRAAVFKVLPGTSELQRLAYRDGLLVPAAEGPRDEEAVFAGYDAGGQLKGYAIPAEGPGFQDTIRLMYGFVPEPRLVVGMEILESRETPGLGDKIYKDLEFVANFEQLSTEPEILVVKKGRKSAANEVDAITGATISSNAVVRIINESNQRWIPRLSTADSPNPSP